ncbi:hypothetical protein MLP03_22905 [Escherichia coli]|nr:hypothetical protein [Escherichia coli]
MNSLMYSFISYFGSAIDQNDAVNVRKDIFDTFRKPYVKSDMATHGPLWNQYVSPQNTMATCDLNIDKDIHGYIFVEDKGKKTCVFLSTFRKFIDYLENRDDGLYPAIYFIDNEFTVCFCDNGERGSMKPIYLYKGIKK